MIRYALCFLGLLCALAGNAQAQPMAEFQKILDTYSKALDASDVETLVGLYSPNGVFMASPSSRPISPSTATDRCRCCSTVG